MTDSPDDRLQVSGALSLGKLAGFRLYLHWSLLLLLLLFPFIDPVAIAIILPSIVVHEFAHAVTYRCLGLGSGSIMIWLFGGFFFSKNLQTLPFQMNYSQRLKYASTVGAGPLSNLVLFGFFRLAQFGDSPSALFQRIAEINLNIALFNLMPISNLDGARLASTVGMSELSRRRLQKFLSAFLLLSGSVGVSIAFIWQARYLAWTVWLIVWGINMYFLSQKTNEEIEAEVTGSSKSGSRPVAL
jgi:Zn-dependent protease